jgi:hypothetical protein
MTDRSVRAGNKKLEKYTLIGAIVRVGLRKHNVGRLAYHSKRRSKDRPIFAFIPRSKDHGLGDGIRNMSITNTISIRRVVLLTCLKMTPPIS